MTLAVSASGSTVYLEPEPVVSLNNAEAMLSAQEREEEETILAGLSQMVGAETALHLLTCLTLSYICLPTSIFHYSASLP